MCIILYAQKDAATSKQLSAGVLQTINAFLKRRRISRKTTGTEFFFNKVANFQSETIL